MTWPEDFDTLPDPSTRANFFESLRAHLSAIFGPWLASLIALRQKVGLTNSPDPASLDYQVARSREQVVFLSRAGALSAGASAGAPTWLFSWPVTILGVRASLGTAGTGQATIIDVNRNGGTNSGTTIFTTQANRPTVAAGALSGSEVAPDVASLAAGEYLTADRDQVGTSAADLLLAVRFQRT